MMLLLQLITLIQQSPMNFMITQCTVYPGSLEHTYVSSIVLLACGLHFLVILYHIVR